MGDALSSQYCRALETANLVFGRAEPRAELNHWTLIPALDDRNRALAALRTLLTTEPLAGTNTVLISHSANLWGLTGLNLDREGEVAIYVPARLTDDERVFTLVADILPTDWIQLASR